jgi:hypothetical protein
VLYLRLENKRKLAIGSFLLSVVQIESDHDLDQVLEAILLAFAQQLNRDLKILEFNLNLYLKANMTKIDFNFTGRMYGWII